MSFCLSNYSSIYLSIYLSTYLPFYLSTYLPIYLSIYISIYLYLFLYLYLYLYLDLDLSISIYLSIHLQIWKRSYSARLPQCSILITSKTKLFCETSFKNGKLSAELRASCQWVLRFFHPICVKCCSCHAKVMPGHTKCAPVTQNHHSKPENLTLQNATPLKKSAPWPPNISDEHVSCTAPARQNASFQILFKCPTPAIVFGHATKPWRFAHFWQGAESLAPATQNHIWTFKSGTSTLRLYFLTWKCASHHNGMHSFDISTSKSAPSLMCFVHFDFQMCFAPQRCALFRHLNFQKCSEREVFLAFPLTNVLRATMACNFSSLIWPDCSAPAALARLFFDPPEPQIIGETQCFATFLPFRIWIFFLPTVSSLIFFLLLFSSLTLPISAFHLSILSEVRLLNFLRLYWHILTGTLVNNIT